MESLKKNCITFDDTFVLRIFHFGGRWSVTLKNRGRSKKTDGWGRPKTRGSSLAVGTYLERGSAPPPPPPPGGSVLYLWPDHQVAATTWILLQKMLWRGQRYVILRLVIVRLPLAPAPTIWDFFNISHASTRSITPIMCCFNYCCRSEH